MAQNSDYDMDNSSDTFSTDTQGLRHWRISSSGSDGSPDPKKVKPDLSVLLAQSQNIIGWIAETLNREYDKKKIGKATADLFDVKIKDLRVKITKAEKIAADPRSIGSKVNPVEVSQNSISTLAEEFAKIVANKEKEIVGLETELKNLKASPQSQLPAPVSQRDSTGPTYSGVLSGSVAAAHLGTSVNGTRPNRSRSRSAKGPKSRADARSKSRLAVRKKKLIETREASPEQAYRIKADNDFANVKKDLWKEVTKRSKQPKIVAIQGKNGDLIVKPQDKESADILRAISKENKCGLKNEHPSRPRIMVHV